MTTRDQTLQSAPHSISPVNSVLKDGFASLVQEAATFGWELTIPTEQRIESKYLYWQQFVQKQKGYSQELRRFESEMCRIGVGFQPFLLNGFPIKEEEFSTLTTAYAFTLSWAQTIRTEHRSLLWFYRPFATIILQHPITPKEVAKLVERVDRHRLVNRYLKTLFWGLLIIAAVLILY